MLFILSVKTEDTLLISIIYKVKAKTKKNTKTKLTAININCMENVFYSILKDVQQNGNIFTLSNTG